MARRQEEIDVKKQVEIRLLKKKIQQAKRKRDKALEKRLVRRLEQLTKG